MIKNMPCANFNLDVLLVRLPMLEVIDFGDCKELEGGILMETLQQSMDISGNCGRVSGDIVELADFPKLK